MDEYKKYEPIFGSWYLSRMIGKGSFGKVFEITREEFGTTYRSALKIITIPQDDDDLKTRMTEGTDVETVSEYYEGILKEIINENEIMSQLKGNSNIVSYEDHQIIPHGDGIGYDILIRMELLTPLLDRMVEKRLDEKEVVKLGIDMCRALELCHKKNIIHRDIKPQNIFISDNGDFKLGDFGIARTMEKTTGGMSKKGTYKYMAPEVFRGDHYDSTVDIYSLGIVLYSLLNGNRGPFLPPPPAKVTHNDEEEARMRRFRGEPIPAPRDASPMLAYIIQKACSAYPGQRYHTAEQMRRDLESYQNSYGNQFTAMPSMSVSDRTVIDENEVPSYVQPMPAVAGKSNTSKLKIVIPIVLIGMILVAAATALILIKPGSSSEIDLSQLMSTPMVSGYDGNGKLTEDLVVDDDSRALFLSDIENEKTKENIDIFLDSVTYTPDATKKLSNDSTINIHADYDADMAEELNLTVTGTDISVTVEGLSEFPEYLEDAVKYDGHYYKLFNDSMLWSHAKAACEKQNGHLATITSQGEQDFIVSLIEGYGKKYNYWLGGTDEAREGYWEWITGEAWTYSNWRKNQPDNGSINKADDVQHYLQICCVSADDTGSYGKWWDNSDSGYSYGYDMAPYYKDTKYSGYICEWDGLDE